MKRVRVLVLSCGLLVGCKVSFGSDPDAKPPGGAAAANAAGETESPAAGSEGSEPGRTSPEGSKPKRTSPEGSKPKRTSPAKEPASWAEGLAALDPKADDALEAVTGLFVKMHPQGSTRASTVRLDLEQLIAFVGETATVADARVQASPELLAAACDSAGYGCGTELTDAGRAEIAALQARGVRYYYTGEGSMAVGVDHAGIAAAVDAGLDAPSKAYLLATHASLLFGERFDEGGFGGDPSLAVDALTGWEALASNPGPYADVAPKQVDATREAYLRLCDAGEFENPSCTLDKALRASYSGFAAAHPTSPSVPAVAAFLRSMKKRRWKATSGQLDKVVAQALAAKPKA